MLLTLEINDNSELILDINPKADLAKISMVLHNLSSGYYADKILEILPEQMRNLIVEQMNLIDDELDLKDATIPMWRSMRHD